MATRVKAHTRTSPGKKYNIKVKGHVRKVKGGITFKGDKWPPPTFDMTVNQLVSYEKRVLKEIDDFDTGKLRVLKGHENHPRFIRRRLGQIRGILKWKREHEND
jgi:hypothetical protein